LAFKFDDVIVRIHPDMDNPSQVLICLNDEPVWSPDAYDSSPKDRDGFCKYLEHRVGVIPGTEGPNQVVLSGSGTRPALTREGTGFVAEMWGSTHRGYTAPDGRGRSSFEMCASINMKDALEGSKDVCMSDPSQYVVAGRGSQDVAHAGISYADFGGWSTKDDPATPFVESPLFTQTDHDMFCSKGNWVNGNTCDKTIIFTAPEPPSDKACADNACPYDMAQQMCKSLKSHQDDYEECLFDYCMTCDETVVAAWEQWETVIHPAPLCATGMVDCQPADICSKSLTMNVLTPSQSNLGGAGPDSGEAEIRYKNAANINGQGVDLVVTAAGQYTPNQAKSGVAGSFGVINVKCGTEVTLVFNIVDSESGAAVTVDNVALSWYDLDEGKKNKGRSTVTSCGDGLLTSSSTELTTQKLGSCWSATSSTRGTAADNPKSPFGMTQQQRERVATFPFSGVSSFTSTINVERGSKGRNFLFAIEPGVACSGSE